MSLKHSPDNPRSKLIQSIKYPLLTKLVLQKKIPSPLKIEAQSPLPQLKQCKEVQSEALSSYLIMRDKFDGLYGKIEEMAHRHDPLFKNDSILSHSKQFAASDSFFKVIHANQHPDFQQFCKLRTSLLQPRQQNNQEQFSLQINTVSEGDILRTSAQYAKGQSIPRKSKYQKNLKPLQLSKLSSNLKDYLSVERMSLRDNQQCIMSKAKLYKKYHLSNLFDAKLMQIHELKASIQKQISLSPPKQKIVKEKASVIIRKVAQFKPPFQTYYYRDFLWKVSFSNERVIKPVEDYPSKIKFYVGGGNNSNLIKGILKRRTWFQITDKIQEAQLIWTQIKVSAIFSNQKSGQKWKIQFDQFKGEEKSVKEQNDYKKQYSVLNRTQGKIWGDYWIKYMQMERKIKPNLSNRSKKLKVFENLEESEMKIHNHFYNNSLIGNKKALFQTMSEYYESKSIDVFSKLPLTFHIKTGLQDEQYLKFLQQFYAINKYNKQNPDSINKFNAWIVKPGQNTNRGNGITVCLDLNEIKTILKSKQKHNDGTLKTYILQKYIQRPLLYKRRKFDIRHYMMLNCSNGIMKGYWYRYGYVRTTSAQYTLKANTGGIHLTNDAVQKYLPDYGKYEKANKITYEELDSFIKKQNKQFDFFKIIYPKMKILATDAIKASAMSIDPQRRVNNFQIFGMDFMIDEQFNVWLIEINTNPCLETNCPVLLQIIPKFIENTFQICVDPIFPPPLSFVPKIETFLANTSQENNFQLIFDERIEKSHFNSKNSAILPEDQDDVFDDDGQDFQQVGV